MGEERAVCRCSPEKADALMQGALSTLFGTKVAEVGVTSAAQRAQTPSAPAHVPSLIARGISLWPSALGRAGLF